MKTLRFLVLIRYTTSTESHWSALLSCPHYQSIDHSTKQPANYEPRNSDIYEELDVVSLKDGQEYRNLGKNKVDVEYLELEGDPSLLNQSNHSKIGTNEYLEPMNANNHLPTGNITHNNKLDLEYLELVDETYLPLGNNSSIVYEIPYRK